MKYFDLFCGVGAFSFALKEHEFVGACDKLKKAKDGYYLLHDREVEYGDINQVNLKQLPNFDILTAGFPCQPFSRSGKRLGLSDPKSGNLFNKILDVVDAKSPEIVFLENVKGLLTQSFKDSKEKGSVFKWMCSELSSRGYYVQFQLINSNHFTGQQRNRIYIIASKKECNIFPLQLPPIVKKLKDHIIIDSITDDLYLSPTELQQQYKWRAKGVSKNGKIRGALKFPDDIERHCRCLTASQGVREMVVIQDSKGYRKLSTAEYCSLQGYNEDVYTTLSKSLTNNQIKFLMGNSITLPVIQTIVNVFLNNYK